MDPVVICSFLVPSWQGVVCLLVVFVEVDMGVMCLSGVFSFEEQMSMICVWQGECCVSVCVLVVFEMVMVV